MYEIWLTVKQFDSSHINALILQITEYITLALTEFIEIFSVDAP